MRLMPTCQEVTRRLLAEAEQPSTWPQQLGLRLHWLACSNCSRFRDQHRTLRQAIARWRTYREE